MSGPVTAADTPDSPSPPAGPRVGVEVSASREAKVGPMTVRRALPRRERRTVGPWCFADHMGPATAALEDGFDIGPHPHMGLQTVTWLLAGSILHRDSLGSEQVIHPGELNLMTAGQGVAHSEETTGVYGGQVHGIQLWVAQPEATRHGPADFEHHADLPRGRFGDLEATVLVGQLGSLHSPARRDTDHLGVGLDVGAGPASLPVRSDHEHALVVLEGLVEVAGATVAPGQLGYLGPGRDELALAARGGRAQAILLGGTPFPEPLLMWWNYVARERAEITAAHREWLAGEVRFGVVESPVPRIEVGPPPWA